MKLHSRIVLVGGLLAASLSAQAAGVVDVKFTQPANYIDAGRSPAEIDRTVSALDTHFKHYAAALPAGQTLHIEVLDVDLAGTVITRPVADVRLVQGRADLPHITLRYTLEADGRTLQSGEEMVTDLDYLHSVPGRQTGAQLPYEKHMLDRWFAQRFPSMQPQ